MKGRGSRGVRRSRRGGQGVIAIKRTFGGGKRTCRSKSRCGGAAKFGKVAFGGSRGVRRSRRSRRGGRGGRGGYEYPQVLLRGEYLNSNDRMSPLRIA